MTPREIRRAAERQALKAARKAANTTNSNPALSSPAKVAANQANAQHSTGPKTETGKKTSSLNALKTALTGRTVVLPTDDVAAYEALQNQCVANHKPATPQECALVQSIIDATWRLQRITNIESGIFALGIHESAGQLEDLDTATRAQTIQVQTYLKYEKSLRNLSTQESRLRRYLVKDTAELQRLQAERLQQETEIQATQAQQPAQTPQPESAGTNFGFEFSNPAEQPNQPESAPASTGEIHRMEQAA